jgi:V/A-type H+-transporting ATPase subunit E
MTSPPDKRLPSQGVDTLIERLRQEGVDAGRKQADEIVAAAEQEAKDIVRRAEEEAEELKRAARAETERFDAATRAALETAARDARLAVDHQLRRTFEHALGRLVTRQVADTDFLRRLIEQAVIRALGAEVRGTEVLLPRDVVDPDSIGRDPDRVANDALSDLVRRVFSDALRAGISLRAGPHAHGLVVRLSGGEIEFDLTDSAITDLLLAHLLPRYRGFVSGVIKRDG